MPAPTKTPNSLTNAAAALEAEVQRYEQTSAELSHLTLTSDKTLQRARKILEECAAHQERLAVLLPEFAQAMQAAQQRQQACIDETARSTAKIKARFAERMELLERVAALGQQARQINQPVTEVLSGDQKAPAEVLQSLDEVGSRTEAAIADADVVLRAAQEGDWVDIARDAGVLKQQLQAARNKVLVAQRSIAGRALS
jgi:hypothetical protein